MTMRSGAELDVSPPLELGRMTDGELIAIRAAEADDAELLRELAVDYVRAGRNGRRLGWLASSRRLPRPLQPLTRPSALDECLLAVEPRTGTPLGMASMVAAGDDPAAARAWVMVRGGVRRRGVGTALLDRLSAHARARGIERFRVRAVVAEGRMLELMRGVGIAWRPAGSLREVDADVPLADGVALGATLWAAARGGLRPSVPRLG